MALLKRLLKKTSKVFTDKTLPEGVMATLLNSSTMNETRRGSGVIRLHVSDLIRSTTDSEFCPREYVIDYFDDKPHKLRGLTAGQRLLFTVGEAIHVHVRDAWIANSPFGRFAWGYWDCPCGKTRVTGVLPSRHKPCPSCNGKPRNYAEFDLYSEKYKITGHPDFIVLYKGIYYIYEVKSIDRKDVVFDDMRAPLGDHTLQASFYYWLLRSMGKKVAVNVRYLYVDRNVVKMFGGTVYKEFRAPASPKARMQPFLDKATSVINSVDSKTLPPRICATETCTRAKKCHAAVICFGKRGTKI